jgi:ABC-type glycerol-3-phosphate transport system substrate-binding protein
MPRAVSRKDFLRLSGVGLAGTVLLGTTRCGGSRGEVVKLLEATRETTALEMAEEEIIARFEEQHPDIYLQREAMTTEDQRMVMQTRLRSDEPPDVFSYDTGARLRRRAG